jgi:hypothetical protein
MSAQYFISLHAMSSSAVEDVVWSRLAGAQNPGAALYALVHLPPHQTLSMDDGTSTTSTRPSLHDPWRRRWL